MYYDKHILLFLYISLASASIDLRRTGWLDKVVEYHKNKLFEDLKKLPAVHITVQRAPPGYVDSKEWDYDSVARLLTLIGESESALPVQRALRRAFRNRRMMTFQESLKAFPSLIKDTNNEFYYDLDSEDDEEISEIPFTSEDDVIVVSNPVESRLPSAIISVYLMRDILEARALAARDIPSTAKTMYFEDWTSMNRMTAPAKDVVQTASTQVTDTTAVTTDYSTDTGNATTTS